MTRTKTKKMKVELAYECNIVRERMFEFFVWCRQTLAAGDEKGVVAKVFKKHPWAEDYFYAMNRKLNEQKRD